MISKEARYKSNLEVKRETLYLLYTVSKAFDLLTLNSMVPKVNIHFYA